MSSYITTVVLLSNLHCSSCVSTIRNGLIELVQQPITINISIMHQAIILRHPPLLSLDAIRDSLENAGFDIFYPGTNIVQAEPSSTSFFSQKRSKHIQQCSLCQQESLTKLPVNQPSIPSVPSSKDDGALEKARHTPIPRESGGVVDDLPHHLTLSVRGMSCASCATSITDALSHLSGTSEVNVNVLGNSASLVVNNKYLILSIIKAIEGCGFEAELLEAEPIISSVDEGNTTSQRIISLRVHGLVCQNCPTKVMSALQGLQPRVTLTKTLTDFNDPTLEVSYQPALPEFSIRTIVATIAAADSRFSVSVSKPPTPEERSSAMQRHEQRVLLRHLLFTIIVAVPTFIIGVVYMSLVSSQDPTREYLMRPIWGGNASSAQWALFFLATPVMFYGAWTFHRRSIKEIISLWHRNSATPLSRRFTRFGSMNLLVSSGVSVAYFSSVALLALAASQPPAANGMGDTTTYFDSVVFLTVFLLTGRCLEAYSKARTADAVTALASLRLPEAYLVSHDTSSSHRMAADSNTDLEKGKRTSDNGNLVVLPGYKVDKVSVDLLEIGDVVRIQQGASPPGDGTIISKIETLFDESSLTGESKPVKKKAGDQVFLGTINKSRTVDIRIDMIGRLTMLDRIINVVREGQTHRAPIERVADVVTGVFVPIVTLLAISTWVVWLSLGYSGALPQNYLDVSVGGWMIWSLQFATAVFVVACPCGIGLAAPTALLVGSGIAAKHGILARGGGEAFQEMAQIDIVAFDKTGTLTEGGHLQVSDYEITTDCNRTTEVVLGVAAELESASTHPIATAIKHYADTHGAARINAAEFDEVAGKGLKAQFDTLACTAIIGSEAWVTQHGATITAATGTILKKWKQETKSIALLAICESGSSSFSVVAIFAVTDPIRSEARGVVRKLQEKNIGTWIISGDNEATTKAVARMVGIPEANVIAGVLPHEKADKVKWLQESDMKRPRRVGLVPRQQRVENKRCIVAMVGDGINDAPALATADVGVSIGSGSDIAISSASFILLSSNLKSLLTLADLSCKILARVKLNFMWAFVYNLIAVPIAAGVLYPAGHIRLAPVWASLAMALSSVSVVTSSLLLKLYKEPKI